MLTFFILNIRRFQAIGTTTNTTSGVNYQHLLSLQLLPFRHHNEGICFRGLVTEYQPALPLRNILQQMSEIHKIKANISRAFTVALETIPLRIQPDNNKHISTIVYMYYLFGVAGSTQIVHLRSFI
ncbi:hypothetical protein D915_009296 [Fasciola hepatica]|uniref:Uncharacterized protein n=1 Tax=Fasciola hepatica TaxID=6192 RepID=A0A4E0RFQ3_FASHE|nr:hypothetical protein D915_009296 [Fasciola hepatica]